MDLEYFDGSQRCLGVLELPDAAKFPGPRPGVVAVHEACHLLLADLVHACGVGERMAAIEEERTVMRLEAVVLRALCAR